SAEQKHHSGIDITEDCSRMCNIMMSRDENMRKLIKANFTPEDYFNIRRRMVGTGMIGGKACGMLLARKLIENHAPEIYKKLEPHDSFYIGSDVFYSYIVRNRFWDIRVRQRRPEEYFALAEGFAQCLRNGEFSSSQKEEFMRLLDYYGQNPIIVRSSSILEDGFGNAFAGKYESVFCANTGSPEKRLEEFENAVKIVYASTMSKGALDYRMRRNLAGRDEQMSLLVQRVSGSRYREYFMPCAAGVGYSYSPYRFSKDTDPAQGMLRLVMGLGTGAVDRVEGSYPRLVHIDKPEVIFDEKNSVRQRKIDVIDLSSGEVVGKELPEIEGVLPYYLKAQTLEHDFDLEYQFRQRGIDRKFLSVTCGGIVRNKALMDDMKNLMQTIASHYEHPVDIEYTINLSETGEYVINLLQCRPLQVTKDSSGISMPENTDEKYIFLECKDASMGLSKAEKLDFIVYIDPIAYYNMNYSDKNKISRALGEINWSFRGLDKNLLLLVPGRICTSSPELGVAATFSEISEFNTICEISESKAGYMPELSYGSHIFQDMVEAEILYAAVFENECTKHFRPDMLKNIENTAGNYCADIDDIKDIIGVYDVSDKNCRLYHDMKTEHLLCVMNTPE
ncbi:MAG: phosphoenolpyruvate synthase, partial [Firmicutes bacterium]|nr:phosphoenolpyruvate synthase [Bacillota bacterium]